MIKVLVGDLNARVNAVGPHQRTPLHTAVLAGRTPTLPPLRESLRTRLACGLRHDLCAMAARIGAGRVKSVQTLVRLGADLNCRDANGNTAAYLAMAYGPAEALGVLVQEGMFGCFACGC
jgi:ankyrin repeat protein